MYYLTVFYLCTFLHRTNLGCLSLSLSLSRAVCVCVQASVYAVCMWLIFAFCFDTIHTALTKLLFVITVWSLPCFTVFVDEMKKKEIWSHLQIKRNISNRRYFTFICNNFIFFHSRYISCLHAVFGHVRIDGVSKWKIEIIYTQTPDYME